MLYIELRREGGCGCSRLRSNECHQIDDVKFLTWVAQQSSNIV
jgi:hypothetical protein